MLFGCFYDSQNFVSEIYFQNALIEFVQTFSAIIEAIMAGTLPYTISSKNSWYRETQR